MCVRGGAVFKFLPFLCGNAMVKSLWFFWRNSHLNFQTAVANKKFRLWPSPSPADSRSSDGEHTMQREAAAASSNYGAKLPSQRRSKEDRDRESEMHTETERRRETERRKHAILVQRESKLTMDE